MNQQDQRVEATEREHLATRPGVFPKFLERLPGMAGPAFRSRWTWAGLLLIAGICGVVL